MATIDVLERNYPGKRAQLKRDILLNALTCFNEHGLELTTIEMIKVQCDTSVGNIYHHFGSKEGLIAALFFCAQQDQTQLLEAYLATAAQAQEGVSALVYSYVDWVTAEPELARFQFQARAAVAKGPQGEELTARNRARNRQILKWLSEPGRKQGIRNLPPELMPSLIVGPAENYCRAWLAGRVQAPPKKYREELALAAWHAIAAP